MPDLLARIEALVVAANTPWREHDSVCLWSWAIDSECSCGVHKEEEARDDIREIGAAALLPLLRALVAREDYYSHDSPQDRNGCDEERRLDVAADDAADAALADVARLLDAAQGDGS